MVLSMQVVGMSISSQVFQAGNSLFTPESIVALLRHHHQAQRQSNAHTEWTEPSDALEAMPGLRSNFCQDLQRRRGERRRDAGQAMWEAVPA